MRTSKIFISVFLFLFTSICSSISGQTFEWVKSPSGPSGEFPRAIALDTSDNVYVTGFFLGTVDFDPGAGTYNLTSNGSTDIFFCKLDASGNFLWAGSIGGDSAETAYGMEVDGSGNIFVSGSFQDTVDFDPGVGSSILTSLSQDIFVLKLDASGNLAWIKSFEGTSSAANESTGLALDGSGNILTTGYFKDTVDFDPGGGVSNLTGGAAGDIFVSKIDGSGNFVWAKELGGNAADKGYSIKTDGSDNAIVIGNFQNMADFDPGVGTSTLTSNGQFDIFVTKLDASGNLVWAKSFGGTNSDYGNAISIDPDDNIYTTGQYFSTVDFNTGAGTYNLTSAGTWDIYINKFDPSGNYIWAKSMGGTQGDEGFGIYVDASGFLYPAGKYRGTADFDPGAGTFNHTSLGDYDIYISKYDTAGNLIWVESFGDTLVDYAYGIIANAAGDIYTMGTFDGTIDFDPGVGTSILTTAGLSDIFVHKISDPLAGISEEENLILNVYPNPSSEFSMVEFQNPDHEKYEMRIYNLCGQIVQNIGNITGEKLVIQTSHLPSGMYFFRLSSNEKVLGSGKFLKE